MTETWRQRLEKALRDRNLSKRGVSLKAHLASGYVHSILSEGKDPTIGNLLAVCQVIGVSPAYVILGFDLTPETEELFALWTKASPKTRDGILQILAEHKAA